MSEDRVSVRPAEGAADLGEVRRLFTAYADWLQADVCLQGFEAELATLPGDYAPPRGGLWLGRDRGSAVGVVALRPLPEAGACELKRLFVEPRARGLGLGPRLVETCIAAAGRQGYRWLRLETLEDRMEAANRLYDGFGFREAAPYAPMPQPEVRSRELDLAANLQVHRVSR